MVSQCANPGCGAPFLYFRDGRLFAAPRKNSPAGIEYFWLCAHCAQDVDLKFSERDNEPTVVPRQICRNVPALEICDLMPMRR